MSTGFKLSMRSQRHSTNPCLIKHCCTLQTRCIELPRSTKSPHLPLIYSEKSTVFESLWGYTYYELFIFLQKLLGETHSTLKALNELEGKVAKTSVDVSNLGSKLWALSDTQFVENRVYDDDDDIVPTHDPTPQVC